MNDQDTSEVVGTDERPLGNIALSLSGGGGRAAGFHLGTLAYLDRVDLLKDVAILSSVSGGSHVAAKYALTLKTAPEEEPLHDTFRGFYKEFFGYLMHADLVRRVFKKLCEPPERESSGRFRRRNAVLALADIYDELENFMNGARFDVFWGDREIHLKEIILNTTEFKSGFAFRFHKGRISRRSGNDFVPLPETWARKARLADIVATSSCIPIGLEPVFFPQDFRWPEDEPKLCAEIEGYIAYQCGSDTQGNKVKAVSLMDGGVYDNQGTDSVALALTKESDVPDLEKEHTIAARYVSEYKEVPITKSLGPLIISDTPILNDNIYPAPDPDDEALAGPPGRLTLGHLNMMVKTFGILAVLMIALNAGDLIERLRTIGTSLTDLRALESPLVPALSLGENFLTHMMPVLVGLYLLVVIWKLRSKVVAFLLGLPESDPVRKAKLQARLDQGGLGPLEGHRLARRRWKDLQDLRLSTLAEMLSDRLSSTWALTGTIFLNRIRSLGYTMLSRREDAKGLVIKNEIYGIVVQENKASKHPPSAPMLAVAQRASTMETQLWYDDDDQLKDLVACGQFTICYNLLEYIDQLRAARGQEDLKAALYSKLESDWETLKQDPFALIDQLEREDSGREPPESSPDPQSRSASA